MSLDDLDAHTVCDDVELPEETLDDVAGLTAVVAVEADATTLASIVVMCPDHAARDFQ
jgi:hypothetical protein